MAKLFNAARMSVSGTPGTGTITLGSAIAPWISFASAGIANADIIRYIIVDGTSAFEIGIGTYTTSGTTLSRDTVTISSSGTSKISASSAAQVYIGPAKEDMFNISPPQGRLTLATVTPVMTSSQSAKTTVYYTPYIGQGIPLWDGKSYTMTDMGGELSQSTTDSTKSPAAASTDSNYDVFVWSDAGTLRATRGPAWTSNTARGTGAGTTELVLTNGYYLNNVAITNGPAASRGTYVGTIRTNVSSQVDWTLGSSAAGGGAAVLNVWNAYNRVSVITNVIDSTTLYTYNSATIRSADASTANRVSFVMGLAVDGINVNYSQLVTPAASTSAFPAIGIGLDSTTVTDKRSAAQPETILASVTALSLDHGYSPQLGAHFIQAFEVEFGAQVSTFNTNVLYNGLLFKSLM